MIPSKPLTNNYDLTLLAKDFLASTGNTPDFSIIDQLCSLSFEKDRQIARQATRGIFSIIEYLCDDFSDLGVSLTSQILTQILHYIRSTPQGADFNTLLNDFGFASQDSILARYQTLYNRPALSQTDQTKVKKILILSRVTAGADIAITSIIIKRLAQVFPAASLVLIGPSHLFEMFGDMPNTTCVNFIYKNDGSLFDKMTSWPKLLRITEKETKGMQPGETLLFDPDSRLSQLGLLPLIPDQQTYTFPSRVSQPEHLDDKNLSFLTNEWLNCVLGKDKTVYPKLTFTAEKLSRYSNFHKALRETGAQFVVTINFGVGNDPTKKIEGAFEEALIARVLKTPKTIVILDTGRGVSELERVETILTSFKANNIKTAQVTASSVKSYKARFNHGLIAFKGSLGELGKMIDATDCFIGYDSCGQHLAAATRTPAVILFAGAPNCRFIDRWAPTNKENLTIPVNTGSLQNEKALQSLLKQIESAVKNIRSRTIVSD